MKLKGFIFTLAIFFSWGSFSFPKPPTDPSHPGVPKRSAYDVKSINHIRKGSFLYLPKNRIKIPLVVFAHGQALNESHYDLLFRHLAGQGIAVLYPKYDRGFFDTKWQRMGSDLASIVQNVLDNNETIDKDRVVFSGHSKGGYVTLMALGSQTGFNSPRAALLLSPAGFGEQALKRIDPLVKISIAYPVDDKIIKSDLIDEIYQGLPTNFKQVISIHGYSDLMPGHFMPLTKRSLFGGRDGIGPFHYYGVIPWLHGALFESEYLYGELVTDSGDINKPHIILNYSSEE